MAHRMTQAPNTFPGWLAPRAPVELAFDANFLTNFPARFVNVGPPEARLRYRVVPAANYRVRVSSTNWSEGAQPHFRFTFKAQVPGTTNAWTQSPRGTVVLLHGYGLGQFAMVPWALRLADDGWCCVLVDLRGHGKSTGKRIYFGIKEPQDLTQLLDTLVHDERLSGPVSVLGESYGATLALRWKTEDARVNRVVAVAPYAALSNAVLNIRQEYADWIPRGLVRAGLRRLPRLLNAEPAQLDTITVLENYPVAALFVAGGNDRIAPPEEVETLYALAAPGSRLVLVPDATHEAVTYYFEELVPPILEWLDGPGVAAETRPGFEPAR